MSKRFTPDNAAVLAAHLRATGRDPQATVVPASTALHGGDWDTHPRAADLRNVSTTVSGSVLHRLAVQLGLTIQA